MTIPGEKAASLLFALCVLACMACLAGALLVLGWAVSGTWL